MCGSRSFCTFSGASVPRRSIRNVATAFGPALDTITLAARPATEMLPGYKEVRPMVFCGLYPLESDDYEKLKAALGRLRLNDAAFVYSSESSLAAGWA